MLLAQLALQVIGGCIELFEGIGLAGLKIGATQASAPGGQALLQAPGFFFGRSGEHNVAKFRFALQIHVEHHIDNAMRGVRLQFRLNRRLKITRLVKEIEQAGFGFLDSAIGIRFLGLIARHLEQARIGKDLVGIPEIEDPKIVSRLEHEQHLQPIGLRANFKLHIFALASLLQRSHAGINFCLGVFRIRRLRNQCPELAQVEVGTPRNINGGNILAFVGDVGRGYLLGR